MIDYLEKIKKQLKNKKWIAYTCIFFLIINGLGSTADNTKKIYRSIQDLSIILRKKNLSDEILTKETILLSNRILHFLLEREKITPKIERPDSFKIKEELENNQSVLLITNYTELIGYILETQSLFDENFSPSIKTLRNEYLKRGIKDKDIDEALENGLHDYQLIAYKLIKLSENL